MTETATTMERLFGTGPWIAVGVLLCCSTVGCTGGEPASSEGGPDPSPRVTASPATRPEPAAGAVADDVAWVGGEVCAECHRTEARAWAGSDHDLAMQPATPATVLGDFADASFTDGGTTTVFRREGGAFFVRTADRDGEVRDHRVPYVFGVDPLQQYLVDVGGGRLQAYPVAWDVAEARWISLYPGEEIDVDDPLHWTRWALNWNQGCSDCHSTGLRKQYDVEADTYDTVWSEIDVSCEACHGPGSAHVAWARASEAARPSGDAGKADSTEAASGKRGPAAGDGTKGLLVDLGVGTFEGRDRSRQRTQIETCAPCHSRRALVHPPEAWGEPFTDAYRPELLREDLYYPDGQILDEVYVYGSFLQSRMYGEGVACTDCHDPHSLRLRAEGNALCTQCHVPERYDVAAHTHHAPGSDGSACVSCHMVATTYMQVDPRRDHGFHLPRPDQTVELGVPNACNRCHGDKTPEWARDRIVDWFGPDRPEDVHEARAVAAGRARAPGASQELAAVLATPGRSAIVRASALHLLQGFDDPVAGEAARAALDDPDPLVRSVAAADVAARARTPEDLAPLVPRLRDESRLVRTEAAVGLSRVGSRIGPQWGASVERDFQAALAEYRRGQEASSDQPAAQMNLGVVHQNLGDEAAARRAYERAKRIEPAFVPARFNLAMLDALSGRASEAEAGFREVLRLNPDLVEARYSLGLLLAESPTRLEESAAFLEEAARAAPDDARYQYNAGLSAQHLGRSVEAEGFLRTAVNLQPDEPEFRNALAILYIQQGRWDEAEAQVVRLRELVGDQPGVRSMLEAVRRRSADGS